MSSEGKPKRPRSPKPLTYLLKQLQNALRASVEEALAPVNLTMAEAAVLAELAVVPHLSNADLARAAFVTPQSMISMLRALEKRGLILRRANPDGGRAMPAELTDEGAKLLLGFYLAMRRVEHRLLADIPDEEQARLRQLLECCLESLRSGGAPPQR
jgi:DNA-binding MarR family transcriptional regulator